MPAMKAPTPTKTDSVATVAAAPPSRRRTEEEEAVANIPGVTADAAALEHEVDGGEDAEQEAPAVETKGNEIPPLDVKSRLINDNLGVIAI